MIRVRSWEVFEHVLGARVWLYAVGWLLLLSVIVIALISESKPQTILRYDPPTILFNIGFFILLVTAIFATAAVIKYRTLRYVPGVIGNSLLIVPVLSLGIWPQGDPFGNYVCGEKSGCFFLTVVPIPTDTVYQIWSAPSRFSPVLTRVETGIELNYSEDGSYLSDPHLLLSGNEEILVLARGGYLVDAINLGTGEIHSEFIGWLEPDRDAKMQANSQAIERILEANL